ncbi:Lrp/AsnC family transcriptional regulator [Zhihengliuella flava]|uniref:Lrp/AsnC family transcriptional regulator for asnA, asnC and gidA n=1 Tax=Zhihengliuella flava TaxID=1285193 RepID=A0A931D5L1_9MICC|nr:Lrp/AsnC family transcriptional regulator [Zhihengliuella flava]MBG6084839.1 Lrp/AsnC family transcriptional regulator for asnA, asnC and gidA [Zhihengliuella flava]
MDVLDELERRITAALQLNPRASWRTVAQVLNENERTIARRGSELLAGGRIAAVGIRSRAASLLVRTQCAPGSTPVTTEALAARADTSFAYMVTGSTDVVAEIVTSRDRLAHLVSIELATTPGIAHAETLPILKYFRTIRSWRIGALTRDEADQLIGSRPPQADGTLTEPNLSAQDQDIVDCLISNARMSYEEISRRAGVSETTARRRVEWLLRSDSVHLRLLVEPAAVGLPVEALVWLRIAPDKIDRIGESLRRDERVRYAAALAGSSQIVVDVTLATSSELYEFVTQSEWASGVDSFDLTMVMRARKRGGRLNDTALA